MQLPGGVVGEVAVCAFMSLVGKVICQWQTTYDANFQVF